MVPRGTGFALEKAMMKPKATDQEPAAKRRIYLVDDHVLVRQGLALMINGTSDLVLCGESGSAEEALQDIPRSKPDVAIVDLSLDGTSGLELIKNLRERHPELQVLVLSMHEESFYAERVLRAGAIGYIMKQEAIGELEKAIRRILDGGIYVSESISDRLLNTITRSESGTRASPMDLLSDRELEIFELIGRGLGSSEIARKLHLSVKTIESYRARLKEKLDLKDASHLLRQALAWARAGFGPLTLTRADTRRYSVERDPTTL